MVQNKDFFYHPMADFYPDKMEYKNSRIGLEGSSLSSTQMMKRPPPNW